MFKEDFAPFCQLLDDVSELRQLPFLSANAKTLFFSSVQKYSLRDIQGAIQAHLLDPEAGKFKTQLQPAHIVAQIEKAIESDGRPDSDEAWGIALLADDEQVTVVWTEEIAQALSAAQTILATGDRTGARMAFKSAYARLVSKARNERLPARWTYSLGLDPDQRQVALQKGVTDGLLPAPYVAGLLPPPDIIEIDAGQARENTRKIMLMLANALTPMEKAQSAREEANQKERERLDALKKDSIEKSGQAPLEIWPQAELKRGS